MSPTNTDRDPVLDILRELRAYDVRSGRAARLGSQCRKRLALPDSPRHSSQRGEAGVWRRAMSVLAGGWCVLYVVETVRRAAAVYGF